MFDLIGVCILGYDVLVLQSQSKAAARNAQNVYDSYAPVSTSGIGGWGWRTGSTSEGLFESDGGIDASQAERDFEKLSQTFDELANQFDEFMEFQKKLISVQSKAANRSLGLTGFGLILIVFGFGLQILDAVDAIQWRISIGN